MEEIFLIFYKFGGVLSVSFKIKYKNKKWIDELKEQNFRASYNKTNNSMDGSFKASFFYKY